MKMMGAIKVATEMGGIKVVQKNFTSIEDQRITYVKKTANVTKKSMRRIKIATEMSGQILHPLRNRE